MLNQILQYFAKGCTCEWISEKLSIPLELVKDLMDKWLKLEL